MVSGFRKTIDELSGKFDKLAVNLVDNRPQRRMVPVQRSGVWCTRCGEKGHYPIECPYPTRRTHYIEEEYEDPAYYMEECEEVDWHLVNPPPVTRMMVRPMTGMARGTLL